MQVIFLDSDNVAIADPAALLLSPEYEQTGSLLWPDYWASWAAPDLATILDLPSLPQGSFESGQMVFDKQRCVFDNLSQSQLSGSCHQQSWQCLSTAQWFQHNWAGS